MQLQALARVVQGRLFSVLRQEMGGTYGVSATAQVQAVPVPEYSLTITFACDPARVEELTTRVFNDIASLRASAPNRGQVNDIAVSFQRDYETNSKQNPWLLSQIAQSYETLQDASTPFHLPDLYNAISPESLQDAAANYLDMRRYVKVTLLPEKKH